MTAGGRAGPKDEVDHGAAVLSKLGSVGLTVVMSAYVVSGMGQSTISAALG